MLLVLALLVAESAAVSYATMGECDANCSPSVYECSSGDDKRFSCSISVWFIVVLVVVGLALLVGIPPVCFGIKPRTRRKRNRNQRGRRNWRRRWRRPSRNKRLAVEEAEGVVPHSDPAQDGITSKIEWGICQSATVTGKNEHSTSPMPQSPVGDMHIPIADASSTEPSYSRIAVSIPIGVQDSDSRRSSKVNSLYFPFYRS